MKQIQVSNLSIGYNGKSIADNINFSIEKGDYLCVIGENGTGKSTLIKTILGLHKPISGTIEFAAGVFNKIAYLPQQTIVQNDFPATVKEVVMSGRQKRGFSKLFYNKQDKDAVIAALHKFEIIDMINRSFKELSGGQKQRVLLARALCDDKEVLFLDEPVAGLDPNITKDLYMLLHQINTEGTSIVMISHDMTGVNANANHILHVGKTVSFE